jgi:hypothetical protein
MDPPISMKKKSPTWTEDEISDLLTLVEKNRNSGWEGLKDYQSAKRTLQAANSKLRSVRTSSNETFCTVTKF